LSLTLSLSPLQFGKQILAQQISGWSAYYLDYKSLKKIINSLEKGRLGDAALFASGIRPEHLSNGVTPASVGGEPASYSGAGTNAQIIPRAGGSDELQAHKAAFFFKLERELEKINAFYLQKEAELKVRLRTLVDKKRVILARRGAAKLSKESPSFFALYEGFRYFDKDLSKLQQFIEVNATGFRKILKKWDKRSKSQTKELYLARQVEVQPCFNREFIAELSDIAAANVLELENLTESKVSRNGKVPEAVTGSDELSSDELLDFAVTRNQEIDLLSELEENLTSIIKSGQAEAAKEMARIARQSEDNTSISRVIWRALLEADGEAVKLVMNIGLPDYTFVDDINWRTCLHEASLAGNLQLVQACVENGVDVAKTDIYGRAAISYAAMNGHAQICSYLLTLPAVNAATVDLDGFSPLVLAVMNGRADVVQILLSHGASVESLHPTDLVPLCLAAQGGHLDITRLLLARGAKIIPNSAGLTPQALAAGEGHAGCLQVLVDAGADANVREKGSLWTPIFYAAENGHLDCLEVLVNAGARLNALDEKSRDASFYAAWRGQIASLLFILEAASRQKRESTPVASEAVLASNADSIESPKPRKKSRTNAEDDLPDFDLDGEIDGIPSLSLPPPIIPFRTYGHNYLDKRALVTVSLTDSSVKLYKLQDPNRPEQFSTSSLKLIMTSRPDESATAIPHTIMLPLADEREVFSFQVESLERFSIEWELMPTFGSKVIGKAVALSSLFEGITDRKRFVLPLQDVYLKVVGEVSFEMDFVKPFDGVQLEIGGRVETYWKSTLPGSTSAGSTGQQRMTPTGTAGGSSYLSSGSEAISTGTGFAASGSSVMSYSSPSVATASTASALDSGLFVTASSLSGQHLRIVVQVTKDGIAVAYPEFTLPVQGLDVYVGSVTGQQFKQFAHHAQRNILPDPSQVAAMGLVDWKLFIERCMMTLQDLLALLPISVGIDLDVLYPSSADVRGNPSLPKIEVNHFVDAILHTVYRSGTTTSTETSRKILFSSRSPTVCTALNWKQPNYAVLFASYCGLARDNATGNVLFQPCDRDEPDARRLSVAEAVRFAKTNNLLGIMVDSILLQHVPQLVHSIKAAGLLLITIGRYTAPTSSISPPPNIKLRKASQIANGTDVEVADGSVEDGIVIAR
jgi:CDK inhibitor PHO81